MGKKPKFKRRHVYLLAGILLAAFLLALAIAFIPGNYVYVPQKEVYVSSENPKQGDTILLEVSKIYKKAGGQFDGKTITFFRNGDKANWLAYLGIDADENPGKYKIYVATESETIEKEINVVAKDFPSLGMAMGKTSISNIRTKDNPALANVMADVSSPAYFKSAFSFPLNSIQRSGLDFGELIKGKGFQIQHFGIDLRAAQDTNVFAANDGKVVLARALSNYGNTIIINHGLGIYSLYLHLDKFLVSEGDIVKNSQVIGLSGSTGYSSGPHLHFSIRDNSARIDPILFVKATKTDTNFLASLKDAIWELFQLSLPQSSCLFLCLKGKKYSSFFPPLFL